MTDGKIADLEARIAKLEGRSESIERTEARLIEAAKQWARCVEMGFYVDERGVMIHSLATPVEVSALSPVLGAMREAKRDAETTPNCPECHEPLEWGTWSWGDPYVPVAAYWCRTTRCTHISPIGGGS